MTSAVRIALFVLIAATPASALASPAADDLPVWSAPQGTAGADWLVSPVGFKAGVFRSGDGKEVILANGLFARHIRITPDAATVALDNLVTGQGMLRAAQPEALVSVNGRSVPVGGLVGQPIGNFLLPEWVEAMKPDADGFHFQSLEVGTTRPRFEWKKRVTWMAQDAPWPWPGVSLVLTFVPSEGLMAGTLVKVHYEAYDGLPVFSKWITVENHGSADVTLDSFVAESLAVVEPESTVGSDKMVPRDRAEWQGVQAFTDMAFGSSMNSTTDNPAVHWLPDPAYATQVNVIKQTPCLLRCQPAVGPKQLIKAGSSFESFRAFVLLHDTTERERRGLFVRRFFRAMAPWCTENPILMHVRSAKPAAVKLAIDQAADVGFEMVIMTFGSGFNVENESPKYLAEVKELADYAHGKGIALGGYSLLASRSVGAENDIINPATGKPNGHGMFGSSPCLGSNWGQHYFQQLYHFYETTGADVLEHDGSYPGDVCASVVHPGHAGLDDSQWNQWRTISDHYKWCRSRGIYLNVPDTYFLSGSNKIAMGYRENNWSLPRAQQEIIERQNIFDGTWEKAPSMGWMFVPLTEYQGGGAAATIEPLDEHLAHYEARLANLFGAGVQACYRGPRLYDTDRTRAVVKKWVDFYKAHRAILDSDLIHLRRADGRDWDGWLHVNAATDERALLMVYNPLNVPIERSIQVPLHYAGLESAATVTREDGTTESMTLDSTQHGSLRVTIPSHGRTWAVFKVGAKGTPK